MTAGQPLRQCLIVLLLLVQTSGAKALYCFSREGVTTVLQAAREYEVLATNVLDSGFMASSAVLRIFLAPSEHVPDGLLTVKRG
jgi:hypothetical protein